jgi:hypothetical protein
MGLTSNSIPSNNIQTYLNISNHQFFKYVQTTGFQHVLIPQFTYLKYPIYSQQSGDFPSCSHHFPTLFSFFKGHIYIAVGKMADLSNKHGRIS